jgi:hypothetical protein
LSDRRERKVFKGLLEQMALLVFRVPLVILVCRGFRVKQGCREFKARLVARVLLVWTVRREIKVFKEFKALRVLRVPQVLKVPQEFKEPLALTVPTEFKATLEPLALTVPTEFKATLEPLALTVPTEFKATLEPLALTEYLQPYV